MILMNPNQQTTPELPAENFTLNSDDVETFSSLWQRQHWKDVPHTLNSADGLAVDTVAEGGQQVSIHGPGTLTGSINSNCMIKIGGNYHLVAIGGSAAGNKISVTIYPGAPSGGYASGTAVQFCDQSLEVHDFQLGASTWVYQPGFRAYQLVKPSNCGYSARPVGFWVRHRPTSGENGIDYNKVLFHPFYGAKYQMARADATSAEEGSSNIAISTQGVIPWASVNYEAAMAACAATDTVTGKDLANRMIRDEEWFSLSVYAMLLGPDRFGSNRWEPFGNNSSLKDVDDTGITFTADPTVSSRALTGTGKKTGWLTGQNLTTHTGRTNGIYDLNGNVYEWTAGLKLKVGSTGKGYLYVDEMDTGIQMPDNSNGHYVTALNPDPKVAKHGIAGAMDSTGRSEFGMDYQYEGTSANTDYVSTRGGGCGGGSYAGSFWLFLSNSRAASGPALGFRAAFEI